MIDLPTEKLTVKRSGGGSWQNGRYVQDATADLVVDASVQPLRGNEVLILPEHRRTEESIKLYTTTKLRTTDEKNNLPCDVVVHDGKRFEVHTVFNWSIGTDVPHYKVICIKEDGEGGGNE